MKQKLTLLVLFMSLLSFAQFPKGMNKGDVAPNFKGKNQNGKTIELYEELNKGKVLLVFYRGNWCPYCEKYLSIIQKDLEKISSKGATVIVVTPEKSDGVQKTVRKTKITFSIITDKDYSIMKSYRISYKLSKETVPQYFSSILDRTQKANKDYDDPELPIPSTYLIGKDKTIIYLHQNTDFRERPDINEVINLL